MKLNLFLGVALLSTLMTFTSCSQGPVSNPSNIDTTQVDNNVLGVTITSENDVRTITKGETLQLTAAVLPETVNQEVEWSTSNQNVATVSNGLVTALRRGTVVITATSVANKYVKASYSIIVEGAEEVYVAPESVKISLVGDSNICNVGGKLKLTASVLPAEAKQTVIWSTSDSKIATVSGGNVLGQGEGEVVITAKCRDDETIFDQITITVEMSDNPLVNDDFASMEYTSHETMMNCENNTKVKVKGVVTHVSPIDEGKVNYYIQNGVDGYYVYAQDALTCPVVLGNSYEVGGYKTTYAGLVEIKTVEHYVPLEEKIEYTVNNLDGMNPMDRESMKPYQNSYVSGTATLEAVTIKSSAYSFTAKVNDVTTTFRVEPAMMSEEEFSSINELLTSAAIGSEFDFKGIMSAYGWGSNPSNQIKLVRSSEIEFK